MATYSYHWVRIGIVEIGIYCYLTADILTKVLQKCTLSSLLSIIITIWILSKPLNLIGFHGNRNVKFPKNIQKTSPLKLYGGWSWNFAEMFKTWAFTKNMFLLPLLMCLRCYGNLKFPLTLNGKRESRPLLLPHCRYFEKSLTGLFLMESFTKHINFVQMAEFDWLPWQPKG